MSSDLLQAISLFENGEYTCVLYRDGKSFTSTKPGISPLVEWLSSDLDLRGFAAADKVVGKAAALLYVLADVKEVYALVMSESAIRVLTEYGIKPSYDLVVKSITSRMGTGICPMEQAVEDIVEPKQALFALKQKLEMLSAHSHSA